MNKKIKEWKVRLKDPRGDVKTDTVRGETEGEAIHFAELRHPGYKAIDCR